MDGSLRRQPLAVRLWSRAQPQANGCWHWTGALSDGYGHIGHQSQVLGTHRVAYELAIGPIPTGFHVDHVCHNNDPECAGGAQCLHRRCINPAHLEAVTQRTNLLRGKTLPAANARKVECSNGHELTPENTFVNRRGHRYCRQCRRATWRRWREGAGRDRSAKRRARQAESRDATAPEAVKS